MNYPTRRARIQAEAQARRSHRRRSLTVGVVGLATMAGATVAGVAPAAANDGGAATTDYSAQQGWSSSVESGSTSASAGSASSSSSASAADFTGTGTAGSGATIQLASYTTNSTRSDGWRFDVAEWASAKAADSSVYYTWGGNGPKGFDCSGFTQNAFAQAGKSIPRNSAAQFAGARQYVSVNDLRIGDLVFWSNNGSSSGIYHVAIYIGDDKIAHARNPQTGVTVTDLHYSPWNMMSTGARY